MGEKYVSVDPGKCNTKTAIYDPKENVIKTYIYQTKYGPGDFDDDALGSNTFIAEINGKVYKVGNGASQTAEIAVTKMSEIHKISTLLSLAMCGTSGETTEMHVVIGCPLSEYAVVQKRKEYMDYILPEDTFTVRLKMKSDGPVEERKIKILSKKVLPETSGIFFMYLENYDGESLGVIDIGGGTAIGAVYNDFDIDHDYDFTDTFGGSVLVASLSQKLTAKFSRYNEKYTQQLLLKNKENRKLVVNPKDENIEQESSNLIRDVIINYLKDIKHKCETAQWSLKFMTILFGGGTAKILKDEIKEVFGEQITFSEYDEMANALGALRRLCQLKLNIDIIEKTKASKDEKKTKESREEKKTA